MDLPKLDFLIIGAYKCGTTTLHDVLREHPQIYLPERKEPNFFASRVSGTMHPALQGGVSDPASYGKLFAGARPQQTAIGEVSPAYMLVPGTAEVIAASVPDVKLIAILRDPVERAFSDFLMYRRDGVEPCADFQEALRQQEARRRRGLPSGWYVESGRYATQLRPYVELFGRAALHVLRTEDLKSSPDACFADLYKFIGVDEAFACRRRAHSNVSGIPRSPSARWAYRLRNLAPASVKRQLPTRMKRAMDRRLERSLVRPQLSPTVEAGLRKVFRPEMAALETLLDRSFESWI